ncbi:MAG: NUDIX hydrolase [Chloroflexota bacterium]
MSVIDAVPARPSASVILVRPGLDGPEMFMVRRHELSGFANNAYVFPGGSIIASDTRSESLALSRSFGPHDAFQILSRRGDQAPGDSSVCLSYWIAAARELLEEGGVLVHDDPTSLTAAEIAQARAETLADGARFATAIQALGVQLSLSDLIYFSHWRTPVQSPKRYDTRFYIAAMPAGQEASHCGIETTDAVWITPGRALALSDAGELRLVYATRAHVERLVPYKTVEALLDFSTHKTIRCVDPIINPDRSIFIDPDVLASW